MNTAEDIIFQIFGTTDIQSISKDSVLILKKYFETYNSASKIISVNNIHQPPNCPMCNKKGKTSKLEIHKGGCCGNKQNILKCTKCAFKTLIS